MAEFYFFGQLKDVVGTGSKTIDLPATVSTVETLRGWLGEQLDAHELLSQPTVRFAINDLVVSDGASITNTDEISVMPPFSGG